MATRRIVPRGDGEGGLGTALKRWGPIHTTEIHADNISMTIPDASESGKGLVQLASAVEVNAGTDAKKAVVPATLHQRQATEAIRGLIELATSAEVIAGTDTQRAVTPAGLQAARAFASTIQAEGGTLENVVMSPATTLASIAANAPKTPFASEAETLAGIVDNKAIAPNTAHAIRGYPLAISGLMLSNNATTPNTHLDISSGYARSSDDAKNMALASLLTKRLDAAWAVGTGNGGLDTGSKAANTIYNIWLIKRSDTGVVDALFSISATAPTMPTNYDTKRWLGWCVTDASSNIIPFIASAGVIYWPTGVPVASGLGSSVADVYVPQSLNTVFPNNGRVYEFLHGMVRSTTSDYYQLSIDGIMSIYNGVSGSGGSGSSTINPWGNDERNNKEWIVAPPNNTLYLRTSFTTTQYKMTLYILGARFQR